MGFNLRDFSVLGFWGVRVQGLGLFGLKSFWVWGISVFAAGFKGFVFFLVGD